MSLISFKNCRARWQSATSTSKERLILNFLAGIILPSRNSKESSSEATEITADWFSKRGETARLALKELRFAIIILLAEPWAGNSSLIYFRAKSLTSFDNSINDFLSASLSIVILGPFPMLIK